MLKIFAKKAVVALTVFCLVVGTGLTSAYAAIPNSWDDFSDISKLREGEKFMIRALAEQGVITGYEDGTFRPSGAVTRAEFATLLCRAMNLDVSGKAQFSDAQNHWTSGYINAMRMT
jgi:hypothetical protein